jgi:predicted transcriptional regulator
MRAALENDDHRVKAIKEAKEKTEYDYEGDMAMGQLKSIIANSQRMHDMLSDDTNLPEWVQSKITLAEDYISTASNYMQGEMNEEKMPFDGPYRKVGERKDKYGNTIKNAAKHLAKKAMNAQKNEEVEQIDEILPLVAAAAARYVAGKAGAGVVGRTVAGAATKYAVSKSMNKEEIEQVDEISSDMAHRYLKGKRERDYDISADGKSSKLKKPQSFAKMNKDVKSSMRALRTIEKSKKTNEETEQVDEVSKATMGRYINKAKDSIDMTSYRSGIKDGTAISSSTPYKSNNPLEKKLTKRHKGISMAVKKLTKEDIDAVKQMNESYKTAFETALNEYGIKSPSELDESKRKEFFNHVDLEFKKGDN